MPSSELKSSVMATASQTYTRKRMNQLNEKYLFLSVIFFVCISFTRFFFLIQISALIEPHNSIIHFLDRFIFLTLLFYALGVIPTFVCLREIHGTVSLVKCELRAFHHSFQSPNVHHQFDAIRRGSISS